MTRQSISFTSPNNEWLNAQVDSEEYISKSDVINDLIRKAREKSRNLEYVRAKLIAAEASVEQHGWINTAPEEMLDSFKAKARRDGKL